MSNSRSISIVVPVYNELRNIPKLIDRLSIVLETHDIDFELIFVDDHSTDGTYEYLQRFAKSKHVTLLLKQGKVGKAYSLVEGFAIAKHEAVGMIDADLQYPPEALPEMIAKLQKYDIVVANRKTYKGSRFRRFMSRSFRTFFGSVLFGLTTDIQSGLKVFTREVAQTIQFDPSSGWSFDLEFLHRAREAGYRITDVAITFEERENGNSHVKILKTIYEIGGNALALRIKKIAPQIIKPLNGSMIGAGIGYKKKKYVTHTTLPHHSSAMQTFILRQKIFFLVLFGLLLFGLITEPLTTGVIIVAILSTVYFVDVLFNLYIILKSLNSPQEILVSDASVDKLNDSDLPVYTILCPLYREAHVIPHFLEAIDKIDWPKNKLDVILLLEEDDPQAKFVVEANSPSYVRAIIVPHSMPKTKPKACNYGLSIAKGEYLVIFDAEDIPDPDQLKKAYAVFQKQPREIICLQAKLNYYNPHHNLLTRFFTAEYSLWFDLTLPGYQSLNTSLPLGGTSNHFRTKDLRTLEGWDPFNVTEDADLGVRLFRKGYRTAIIDSTTLEEANSSYRNWLRQRSRWIKGYMQTYLVQMRSSFTFVKEHKFHALLFQLTVGGKLAFILINPFLWITTIAYFTAYQFVGPAIEAFYPPLVFYMAVISLVFGNFLFLYYYMIGCARREQWALMKYVFFIPIYWLMISIAGFMAFFQLIFKPHYWEKTVHGLHLKKDQKQNIAKVMLETEAENSKVVFPKKERESIVSRVLSKKHYAGGVLLIGSSVFGNVFNLIFSTYFGRILSPTDFGVLALISTFWSVISIFLASLGTTVNHRTGYLDTKFGANYSFSFWRYLRSRTTLLAVVATVVWVLISPFLASYFQVDTIVPFLIFSPVWLFAFSYYIDHGYLSGKLMFGWLAIVSGSEVLLKLAFGYAMAISDNTSLAYAAMPISFIVSFFVGWIIIRLHKPKVKEAVSQSEVKYVPKKFFVGSLLSGLATVSFLTLDVILAKHYLSPVDAGRYALLSLVGKMIFFAGLLASQFIVPLVSRDEGASRNSRKTFYLIMTATAALSGAAFVLFALFGSVTLTHPLLLGEKIQPVLQYVPFFGFAMLCFVLARNIVTYHLTRKVYLFPVMSFLVAGVQIILINKFHDSVASFVEVMLFVGGLNFVLMVTLHIFSGMVEVLERNIHDFFSLFTREKKYVEANGKLRILIYNWRDIKHVWAGGAEVYVHEVAKRFVEEGNHVTVFCGNDGKSQRNQTIDGVHIVRRGGTYAVYFWAMLYHIFHFHSRYDIIIDCENGLPFFTPLYSRKPVFLLIHHIHQEVLRKYMPFPLSYIAAFLEGRVMPVVYRNKRIITISESSRQEILKMGITDEKNITIVHPGINSSSYSATAKTAFPLISYLGRLKPYKKVDIAIYAFEKVLQKYPDAQFWIAGMGDSIFELNKLVQNRKLEKHVIFFGKVDEKKKSSILSQSWVVVQPSMIEGWGITVIEANVLGTPVIASDVNGLRDSIVHGKTGLLVAPQDADKLGTALLRMIGDKKMRTMFSKDGILWSQRFSWDKSAEKFYMVIVNELKALAARKQVVKFFAAQKGQV